MLAYKFDSIMVTNLFFLNFRMELHTNSDLENLHQISLFVEIIA